MELLKLQSEGGPVTPVLLAQAVSNMNSCIQRDGLSACEIWTQKDQMTGKPLPFVDRDVILSQNAARKKNHQPRAKSKASGKLPPPTPPITIGDLIFLKGDKSKTKVCEKYLVIAINNSNMSHLRKFTSSQFQSKVYVVPITDCYLIQSNIPAPTNNPLVGIVHSLILMSLLLSMFLRPLTGSFIATSSSCPCCYKQYTRFSLYSCNDLLQFLHHRVMSPEDHAVSGKLLFVVLKTGAWTEVDFYSAVPLLETFWVF